MQTFLPHPRFVCSAMALDPRRLGKQRVEALQILNALHRETGGWRYHPAVKMWRGSEQALVSYAATVTRVWRHGGRNDTVLEQIRAYADGGVIRSQRWLAAHGALPAWLGDEDFHRAHQSSLVRKDPEWYRPMFPDVPDDLPYVWPPGTDPG